VKHHAVGACAVEDRIDAKIGLGTLGLGFVLQAGGYLVTLAGAPKPQASTERALIGFALAALAAVVAVLAWRFARRRMISRDLVTLARWESKSWSGGSMLDQPDRKTLAWYGRPWLGHIPDEEDEDTIAPPDR
jgi:hypothetical protein